MRARDRDPKLLDLLRRLLLCCGADRTASVGDELVGARGSSPRTPEREREDDAQEESSGDGADEDPGRAGHETTVDA